MGNFLALYLAVTPLIIIRKINDNFNLPKYVFIFLGVIIFLAWYFSKVNREKKIKFFQSPFYFPLALLFFWQILSGFKATNVYIWLLSIGYSFLFLLFFFLMIQNVQEKTTIFRILKCIVLAGIFVSVYGIFQHYGFDFLKWTFKNNPLSTLGRRNFAAEYLAAIIPYAIFLILIVRKKKKKILYLFALMFFLFHLFLTFTRASWMAFFFSAVLSFLLLKKIKLNYKILTIIGLIFITVFPSVIFSDTTGFTRGSVRSRMLIWKGTLLMIKNNPVLGVGTGNFEIAYPFWSAGREDVFRPLGARVANAHNDYLEIAAENGIIGLLFFLFLVFTIFKVTFLNLKRGSPEEKLITVFVFSSLIAILVNSFAAFPLKNPSVILYFYLNLAFLSILYNGIYPVKPKEIKVFSIKGLPFISGILIVVFIFLSFSALRSSFCLRMAKVYMKKSVETGNPVYWAAAEKSGRESVFFNPYNLESHFQLGKIYLVGNYLSYAKKEFSDALKLNPNSDTVLNNLGMTYHRTGPFSQAEKFYLKSLKLNPDRPETRNNLGSLYLEEGEIDKSIFHLKKALKRKPNFPEAKYNLKQAYLEKKNLK